jgi:hypothetical protein
MSGPPDWGFQYFSGTILPGGATAFIYQPAEILLLKAFLIATVCDVGPVELVMSLRIAERALFSVQKPVRIDSFQVGSDLVRRHESVVLTVSNKSERAAVVFGRFVCSEVQEAL